jgi:glucose/mannose-6-phosphate isomerase
MMVDLDRLDLAKVDPDDMMRRIRELPQQCSDAWANAQKTLRLPDDYKKVTGIVILGMGGSAIGGDLVRTLVQASCPVPVTVSREYDLPAYASKNTLVIGCSYSGGTEETLSAFAQAAKRGCKLLAVTTGGQIEADARSYGAPLLMFEYPAQPRGALGHSFILLLAVLRQLGFIADAWPDLQEAIALMQSEARQLVPEVGTEHNPAKQMALKISGRLPIIYGAGILSEVARRWKGQVNENAKAWAFFDVLPELDHNSVVGYELPKQVLPHLLVVSLEAPADHPRVKVRQQVTRDLLQKSGVQAEVVRAQGKSALAQMLWTIHLGDFTSYYLATLNGADPTPVTLISYLKQRLAEA